jgi:hypothetical protein
VPYVPEIFSTPTDPPRLGAGSWGYALPTIRRPMLTLRRVGRYLDSDEKGKILLKMVEIKARGAAKAEFTNVNENFAATNNAEFGLFQQNLFRACSAFSESRREESWASGVYSR